MNWTEAAWIRLGVLLLVAGCGDGPRSLGTAAPLTIDDAFSMVTPTSTQLSPDGRRVAFTLTRVVDGDWHEGVHVISTDGAESREIAVSGDTPRWNPDGTRIAWINRATRPAQVWCATPEGEQKKQLTDEEREYKSKRKLVQEKLIKFATRIPAFMYLTDFRENTLQDVITKLEPDLFLAVTGLTVKDFHLLVRLKVFNTEQMNQAVFAFRRYEDASLRYTGIESHEGLTHYGLYDTVVARD